MNGISYIVNVEAAIENNGRWLVIRRSEQEEIAPGQLAFVGGKLEITKDSSHVLEATLKREIQEEVGIQIRPEIQYIKSDVFIAPDQTKVLNHVFVCHYASGEAKCMAPHEVAAVHWMTLDEILRHKDAPPWLIENVNAIRDRKDV